MHVLHKVQEDSAFYPRYGKKFYNFVVTVFFVSNPEKCGVSSGAVLLAHRNFIEK